LHSESPRKTRRPFARPTQLRSASQPANSAGHAVNVLTSAAAPAVIYRNPNKQLSTLRPPRSLIIIILLCGERFTHRKRAAERGASAYSSHGHSREDAGYETACPPYFWL